MLTHDQLKAIRAECRDSHRTVTSDANAANYTQAELQFLRTMQKYKSVMHRLYPTWSEILAILRALGWQEPEPPKTREK